MFITNTILQNLINFCAPILGIVLIIFCIIQGWKIFRGNEGSSVKGLVSGVLLILFLLGIMFAAGSFETYGRAFEGLTNTLIEDGAENAARIVG